MNDITTFDKPAGAPSRRALLKATAWSAPVVAVSVATPFAAATTPTINTDLVLEFGDVTHGSTRDITFAVVDFIDRTVRSLGPQEPAEPELVLPPRPATPSGNPFTNPSGWAAYATALAQWTIDTAEANAGFEQEVAEYLRALAEYQVWDLAVTMFINRLREVALQSEGLFFASATYPRNLVLRNAGPETLAAGSVVTVQVTTDINLVNAYLPQIGGIQLLQTGGTTLITHTVTAPVPAGGVVFTQPLVYNPVAVSLGITGTVEPSSITALLAPPSQDDDVNDNGDVISSDLGVILNVATGDVQAILAEWRTFLDQAIAFYELVSPFLPELDWQDIIGGLLPISAP